MVNYTQDRLSQESTKAYAAFLEYRNMDVDRSIDAAWKRYSKTDKITPGYFRQWSVTYHWVERARAWDDFIEAEAQKKIAKAAIDRKAKMLERHASIGRTLQGFGLEYVREHKKVDKSADAITAITKGVEMERKAENLPDWVFEVTQADDDDLIRRYHELAASVGGGGSGTETPGDTDPGTAEGETPASPAD